MTFDPLTAAAPVAAVAREHAASVDVQAVFPTATLDAARKASLLGVLSSKDVGGHGLGIRQAAAVVELLARECGSSAMVLTMHYCGAAVIEAHGSKQVRSDIAAGRHLSTLAFSEAGSRSHFWVPTGTARLAGDRVTLDAKKSWITSANHATAYVWSSKPCAGSELSTLWLVPRETKGLQTAGHFDGLGLRGNDSTPVTATGVAIAGSQRLGADGGGFGIMMGTVLPTFALLSAASSVGLMESAVSVLVEHVTGSKYAHLPTGSALADLPTIRAYVARMRIRTDMARALWQTAIDAVEGARADAMLKVLAAKAGCGEAAAEVLDLAMRVGGGLAFRREVGVERRFRDARAAMIMAPTSDQLFDFIGKAVCGLPLF
jgi:alkylation response protein AidB-like acyl-CoA dehydrogenase